MSESIFKDRYVLGEGYPWPIGIDCYDSIALSESKEYAKFIDLSHIEDLWSPTVPKYRLVLEKIKDKE